MSLRKQERENLNNLMIMNWMCGRLREKKLLWLFWGVRPSNNTNRR